MADRIRALLCLVGVVGLTAAWTASGLLTDGFDPVRQSISQLQRDGTATAAVLTAALVAFAVGGLAFARLLPTAPRVALVITAVATLGAAAAPLGEVRGGRQDALHLACGATGYVAVSLLPLLAAPTSTGRARTWSLLAGAVASACLLGTVPADAVSGALQRVGFLAAHLWLAAQAVQVLVAARTLGDVDRAGLDVHLDQVLVGGQRPTLVVLAESDPAWPQQFREHRERIRQVLDGAEQLEHVGSTSVPGLAAKPIIDVQLAVVDLDEAVRLLTTAGYVLRVREPGHRLVQWPAPAAANVHLHLAQDVALAERLLLRDRLRADPAARRRYEDVNRSLAGREWPDVNHYADAKGPVIRELLARG